MKKIMKKAKGKKVQLGALGTLILEAKTSGSEAETEFNLG